MDPWEEENNIRLSTLHMNERFYNPCLGVVEESRVYMRLVESILGLVTRGSHSPKVAIRPTNPIEIYGTLLGLNEWSRVWWFSWLRIWQINLGLEGHKETGFCRLATVHVGCRKGFFWDSHGSILDIVRDIHNIP